MSSKLTLQLLEWYHYDKFEDDEDDEDGLSYQIVAFGNTLKGTAVTIHIKNFYPFYYIRLTKNFKEESINFILSYIESNLKTVKNPLVRGECSVVYKKDLYGFKNNKISPFIKLVFTSLTAFHKSKYLFKNPILIKKLHTVPTKFKLYESNFDPFLRFCHIKEISTAGWITVSSKDCFYFSKNSIEIDYSKIQPEKNIKDIANFLQMSWDIETYSFDRTFPDPKYAKNVIYQIAVVFKRYKSDDNNVQKYLLTLKHCDKIDDSTVIEYSNEKDLLIGWIDLVSKKNPDIMYTYNGDTFDCRYVYERCKLYNLESYLLNSLSRLEGIAGVVKKETFSSSAYGDSDYVRFYIPGRLNYDLLIHYKRGTKMYPSYKLDYITNEILGEGKHPVTPKQIFDYYDIGTPDKIKEIGLYCIQDTFLLQKLVDKQLILISILQLANVTYVPVKYLLTRGQSIKVYSQLLRKAREMNYLVPHTNFNEDSYPIVVKTREEHQLEQEYIGEYLQIYSKNLKGTLHGKLSEIIDSTHFVVKCNIELETPENYSCKIIFPKLYKEFKGASINNSEDLIDTSFSGATVLDASPGMYNENIAVLDFASLYPTIMISRNLCYSTFIMDPKYLPKTEKEGIFTEGDTVYERIKWDDKIEYTLKHTCEAIGKTGKTKGQVCGKQAFFEICYNDFLKVEKDPKKLKEYKSCSSNELSQKRYYCRIHDLLKKSREEDEKYQKKDVSYNYVIVQKDNSGNNKGVLPALLEELYSERKSVKKQMEQAAKDGNKLLEDILNSVQLAIKISLNSTYGFLGRSQGNLILKELGSIVTAVGRNLIKQSKDYAENIYKHQITDTIMYNTDSLQDIDEKNYDIILEQFKI